MVALCKRYSDVTMRKTHRDDLYHKVAVNLHAFLLPVGQEVTHYNARQAIKVINAQTQ